MSENRPLVLRLVDEGRLVAQSADARMLADMIDQAAHDIAAPDANKGTFGAWADAMLYEAGLRSVRAVVQANGYRIVVRDRAHMTAIDAADALTGGIHYTVFTRLHRMRRRRNEFMYEATAEPTDADLQQARRDVSLLLTLAREAVSGIG